MPPHHPVPLLFLDVDGPLIPFGAPNTHPYPTYDPPSSPRAPWLGLAPVPVVQWPDEDEPPSRLHWKTRPLTSWAAARPFIWLDDELTEHDRAWVTAHHPAPALLHRVDHRYGLTDADFGDTARAPEHQRTPGLPDASHQPAGRKGQQEQPPSHAPPQGGTCAVCHE